MKFKFDERGFVLAEFAIALPLLILLLYALGTVTLTGLKIAREQVADYALETEAQYVIDRIATDARVAHTVKIKHANWGDNEEIFFVYHTLGNGFEADFPIYYAKDILDQRRYTIHSPESSSSSKKFFQVYAERQENGELNNPITGDISFGQTSVKELTFDKEKLRDKILHIKFKLRRADLKQVVEFNTSVYMPACKKIIYHEETILNEE